MARLPKNFTWAHDPQGVPRAAGAVSPELISQCIEGGIARGHLGVVLSQLPKGQEVVFVSGTVGHVNDYSVEFFLRLRLAPAKRRELHMRTVVARNDRDRGEILKREIKNLQWVSQRIPKHAFTIERTGSVFQPDRHGRAEHHRRLPAYVTGLVPDLSIVTFGNREQLAIAERTPRLLTRDDTDHIRRRVIELCLRALDPDTRRALPPPELDRGALRLKRTGRGKPEPFIAGCPTLWDRVDAITLLHRIAGFEWRRGNDVLPLLPSAPEMVLEACVNALGRDEGRALIRKYAAALESKRLPEHRRLPHATLLELIHP